MIYYPNSKYPYIPVKNLSNREILWITDVLIDLRYQMPPINTHEERVVAVDYFLANYGDVIPNLISQAKGQLLRDEEFDWIFKNNYRQLMWIKFTQNLIGDSNVIKEEFIRSIDFWNVHLSEKKASLAALKTAWSELLQLDKKYKWLEPKNHEQLVWAWGCLKESNQDLQQYSPIQTKDYYDCILSAFDCWIGGPDNQKVFFDKTKKAWSQQKYRSNLEGKKQRTIVLQNDDSEMLDELVSFYNKQLGEVLGRLIRNDHFQNFPSKK